MANAVYPAPFQSGFREVTGEALNVACYSNNVSSQDAITAHAGGGATSAVVLLAVISRIATVASANDSVKLRPSIPGIQATVANDGANNLALYASGSDTIGGLTSIVIPPGGNVAVTCPVAGKWDILGGVFNGQLVDVINTDTKVMSAALVLNATATLTAVPGLSIPVTQSGTYALLASFPVTGTAGAGVQLSLDTTNSLTMTNLNLNGKFFTASGVAVADTVNFQSGIGSTAAVTLAELSGAFTVNAAGTLIIKAAQNASTAYTTSFNTNGFVSLTRSV